ncbi:MAG: hypothetical protein OEY93_03320 [Anaerolineae bacterium]|nr:hypothetical protein [Anaerolineae bacterium]
MNVFDKIVLLVTGLAAIYLIWIFSNRNQQKKLLFDIYYLSGFGVLLVSALLMIFLGYEILASPYVLTAASLILLGISTGLVNLSFPHARRAYSWFALIGSLAIAFTSIAVLSLKKFAVPVFHGAAGLIIFGSPIKLSLNGKKPKGFWWVENGGMLIGMGGIALAFMTLGSLLLFFSQEFVLLILAPLLLFMTLAFNYGFLQDIKSTQMF